MALTVSDPVAVADRRGDEPHDEPFLTPAQVAAPPPPAGPVVRAGPRPIRGAAVDSRRVLPGQLFVALPGERTDGHEYIAEAVASGATCVLVTRALVDG